MPGDGPGGGGGDSGDSGGGTPSDAGQDDESDDAVGNAASTGTSGGGGLTGSEGNDTLGNTPADPTQDDTVDDNSLSGIGPGFGGDPSGPSGTDPATISAALSQAQEQSEEDDKANKEEFDRQSKLKPIDPEVKFEPDPKLIAAEKTVRDREETFPNLLEQGIEKIAGRPVAAAVDLGLGALSFFTAGIPGAIASLASNVNTASGLVGGQTLGGLADQASFSFNDENDDPSPSSLGDNSPSPASGDGPASGPAPGPSDDQGGGDYIPPRRAVVRAASNNTTLAIAENEDIGSRKNLRRARRQITRFA